jgi:hypothetical protein
MAPAVFRIAAASQLWRCGTLVPISVTPGATALTQVKSNQRVCRLLTIAGGIDSIAGLLRPVPI